MLEKSLPLRPAAQDVLRAGNGFEKELENCESRFLRTVVFLARAKYL